MDEKRRALAAGASRQGSPAVAFLFGGGEMGARMRAYDWSRTPLGAPEGWPQSLKTVVRIMLDSRYAMWMGWGPDFTFFCNDAYLPTVGSKQAWVLGASAREVWAEIWPDIGPRAEHVMRTGSATWDEDLLLFLERSGFPEETYHTFSYSPIRDDDGRHVAGMLCVVTEDTERTIGERRLQTLRALSAATLPARSEVEACELAVSALAGNALDLPFVAAYLWPDGAVARLAALTGLEPGTPGAPLEIGLEGEAHGWPLAAVLQRAEPLLVEDVGALLGHPVQAGPWPEPVEAAMVLPLAQGGPGSPRLAGFVVAGLSPRRPLDDAYRDFLGLVASQMASAVGDARAFSEEQRRAASLAELDRAKTTFFSNVSHEFRTPLALMLSPLEELLGGREPLPEAVQEPLSLVYRNGQRLAKLVNALLDFSRIEAGRIEAVYEPVDLACLTAELASVFRSAIERAGLRLAIDCAPLPQPVYVDREIWEKIVLNLVSNAFKFTLEGFVRVTLREAEGMAVLQVADSGIGIPADALPHLFDRFFRVEGAGGRSAEGTGIGLALVLELARLHGGSVAAESRLGRGSVFTVRLPFGHAHLAPERTRHTTRPRGTGAVDPFIEEAQGWVRETAMGALEPISVPAPLLAGPQRERLARVLVVDDNADMRDYLRRLLDADYEVLTAADGQQALVTALRDAPDLVLADVMMPRLGGLGLLAALRARAETAALPVILLSARAGGEARIEGLAAGADDVLAKPFSARELLARIGGTLALARQRREALRREEQLRSEQHHMLEHMLDAFVAFDAGGRIRSLNAAAERMFGLPREALLGEALARVRPALAQAVEPLCRDAVDQGEAVRFEHRDERSGRVFDMQAFPLDGALALYARDITEKRHGEEALRASEQRFRRLADSMPQLVFAADPLGSITYINRYGREVTGTTEEMLGQGRFGILHPEDRDRVRQQWRRSVAERRPYQCESRLRQADGQYRWVLSRAQPVLDERGEVLEWIGASTDIHDLQLAQQALDEADRRKDRFLATLAHELRNPLAPLKNAVQILRRSGGETEAATRVHAMMERQIDHMVRLVDDLLEVSRIASGKIELRRARVPLAAVLQNAAEASRPLIERRGQALQVALPPQPLTLEADAVRLAQVFANLLNNAAKFSEPGGHIEVSALSTGAWVEVSVRDHGIGIAPHMLPQVFEMFAQAEQPAGRVQDGLGIGLSLVKSLVGMHGGSVEARSEGLGRGSEFLVRLPLAPAVPEEAGAVEPRPMAQRETSAAAPAPSPRTGRARRARVLVVDDNRDAADSLGLLLDMMGAEVRVVNDGPSALDALPAWQPELVLLDLGMPGMDGHEVARRIRADPAHDALRLVALTGWGQAQDRARTAAEGFDGHLVKPADMAALETLLAATASRALPARNGLG